MKPIRFTVWHDDLHKIGDWCMENIDDWAFSSMHKDIGLNNYVVSNLNWQFKRHLYVNNEHKKCILNMRVATEEDIMAIKLRWSI